MVRKLLLVVAALAIVGVCIPLGLWQLRRLEEKQELRDIFVKKSTAAAVDLVGLEPNSLDNLYRHVYAEGIFLPSSEVVIRGRTLNGRNGNHVLTPLLTNKGAVMVDRGWVEAEFDSGPVVEAPPPRGTVKVSGILLRTEATAGKRTNAEQVRTLPRPDIKRITTNRPWAWITDYYLAAENRNGVPVAFKPDAPTTSRHLSYAVQWFIFAALGPLVAVLLLRRAGPQAART